MSSFPLLVLLLIPFTGAVVLLFVPRERPLLAKVISAVAGTAALALSLYIFISYDRGLGGYQFQVRYAWLEDPGISFHMGVDGISAPMVLLTGIVMFTGVFISWNINFRTKDFFLLLMALVTGVFGVFIALDLFFLFFFYELAVLPMYVLIGVWGSTRKEYGAMKLVLYLTAGSALVWIGLIAMYIEGGIGSFNLLDTEKVAFARTFQAIFFPFFMLGFGVLAGLWPFHTWSPDGHVAAPTAVSMLHAGVLMKLGAYGLLRVGVNLLPEGARAWMPLLIVLGTVNVVYGAFSAMAQKDLKFVIGYSSVSHMGYVLMGIATLSSIGMAGAVLQMFSHGIMTALFFALVGVVYDRAHTRDIYIFEGLAKKMGFTAIFFMVAGMTSLGLPGLSGFVAELLVFLGTFKTYPLLGVLAVVGAAITAVYILRLLGRVFLGPLSPKWQGLPDATPLEVFAMGCLVLVLVGVGIYPFPFTRLIDTAVIPLIARVGGVL